MEITLNNKRLIVTKTQHKSGDDFAFYDVKTGRSMSLYLKKPYTENTKNAYFKKVAERI